MKGSTIRQRLTQMGMSQAELARLLKVSPQTVNRMLHTANILTGTLERICEVMHLPITYFYDECSKATRTVAIKKEEAYIDSVVQAESDRLLFAEAPSKSPTDNAAKFWQTCRIGDKVKSLLSSQHRKMGDMCKYVGMTEPGMHKVFERDSCKINILLKMSEYFNVPINYFLPEDRNAKAETEKDREIQYLKGQVKAYETALATMLSGAHHSEPPQPFAISLTD